MKSFIPIVKKEEELQAILQITARLANFTTKTGYQVRL
jgi:hypothetical protein